MTLRFFLIASISFMTLLLNGEFCHGSDIYKLSSGSKLVNDYERIVNHLSSGDTIEYDGRKFKLLEYLDEGAINKVFAISDTKAVRIVKSRRNIPSSVSYIEMYQDLRLARGSVVQVFPKESVPELGLIVVQRIYPAFTLSNYAHRTVPFIKGRSSGEQVAAQSNQKVLAKGLRRFVQDMAPFSVIGDYNNNQVHWDGATERFVLVDWQMSKGETVLIARRNSRKSPVLEHLQGRPSIPNKEFLDLRTEVMLERVRLSQGRWIQSYLKECGDFLTFP